MSEEKKQEQLEEQDLQNVSAGRQSGDDEAEDSIVLDGARKSRSTSTATDDVYVEGKIITGP